MLLLFIAQDSNCGSIATAGEDGPETEKLLLLFVQRCQQNLLGLNRFISTSGPSSSAATSGSKSKATAKSNKSDKSDWAKKLYSQSLLLPNSQANNFLEQLCSLIDNMSKEVQRLK